MLKFVAQVCIGVGIDPRARSPRPGRGETLRCRDCPWGAETTRRRPENAISRTRQDFPTSGSGCDVHGV